LAAIVTRWPKSLQRTKAADQKVATTANPASNSTGRKKNFFLLRLIVLQRLLAFSTTA
jgi:hypothetical protein